MGVVGGGRRMGVGEGRGGPERRWRGYIGVVGGGRGKGQMVVVVVREMRVGRDGGDKDKRMRVGWGSKRETRVRRDGGGGKVKDVYRNPRGLKHPEGQAAVSPLALGNILSSSCRSSHSFPPFIISCVAVAVSCGCLGRRVEGVGRRVEGVGKRVEGVGRRVEGVGRRVEGVGRCIGGVGRCVWPSAVVRQGVSPARLLRPAGAEVTDAASLNHSHHNLIGKKWFAFYVSGAGYMGRRFD
ncbi:hypothetical protein Pmani_038577 [Petrolisthes manimaculis]|uniref:Uncharacterized protein n=1 Tax=Petrolisthes manimaculis TaxID=1843537 RepID=A0AAE1NE46_9EUCA|nr:hypothetical protein Pmani_038577 [Petrolisthes manimaculis]